MSNQLEFVYASGGLVSQSVLANALSDSPSGGDMRPAAFAYGSRDTETPSQHAETVETAFQLLCERYDAIAADIDCLDTSTLREKWLVPLLSLLDFEPTFQRARLKSSDGRETFDITHLGWNAEDAPPLVLVPGPLDDAAAGAKRCPHMELQVYLNRSNALWGIAANARELRLLRDFHHTTLKAYVGFDLNAIFATRDFQSFRALYRLAHRSRLVPREDGKCILEALFEKSQAEGVQVGKVLRDQVQTAIEALAEGLLSADVRAAIADPKESRAVYEELLLLIYRIMFLLFAEQRRMLPAEGIYAETYSLTTLARIAETRSADPHHCDLWEGLKATFLMLSKGAPAIGVFPYNGRLFDPGRTPRLVGRLCENRYLLEAVSALTQVTVSQGRTRLRQRVNYAAMGVEELGSVYESLLNYSVKRADAPIQTEAGRMVPKGGVYLAPLTTERKDLGAYYTPPELVDFVLEVSLDRLIAERLEKAGKEAEARERALLDLRICDPACGSGAFLVGAVDRIALALAGVRSGGGQPTERTVQLARRDVLRHCIYGVDKNPLAVELAKLALWLESHAEGMPLTFLDHRLVVGDSLTGPFWDKLIMRPSNPEEPVEGVFHQGLTLALQNRLAEALSCVRHLEATVGISMAEVEEKERIKAELDRALRPFRIIAAAWSGGVMLGPEKCDDLAYGELLASVAKTGEIPATLPSPVGRGDGGEGTSASARGAGGEGGLPAMIARGLGVDLPLPLGVGRGEGAQREGSSAKYASQTSPHPNPLSKGEGTIDRDQLYALLESARCVPALPYDLAFPEVFYPTGVPHGRTGFDAVLGNPPWEAIQFKSKEFFAAFDFEILSAPTKRERTAIEKRLTAHPAVGPLFEQYVEVFEQQKRVNDCLYQYQKVFIEGDLAGRQLDAFRVFMERNSQLLYRSGMTGVVVPSAFHANEGATGVRQLYLEKMALRCCYSFENRRALFEIHRSFKFALVVARAGGPTREFSCAFYLHDDEWLFGQRNGREPLRYTHDFVRRTGGDYLSLLELQSEEDVKIAQVCFANGDPFGQVCERARIRFGAECHMTNDAWRFTPTVQVLPEDEDPRDPGVSARLLEMGYLMLHEGKTFWHYDDHWESRPKYVVSTKHLQDRAAWQVSPRLYRLAFRKVASSTNERTFVIGLLPPLWLSGDSVYAEQEPPKRPNHVALALATIGSAFATDWAVRQLVSANVNLFIVNRVPFPPRLIAMPFVLRSGLRLTCNHSGYEPLWREQVGDAWREEGKPPMTWPVLATDDERWEVRAAIDAVVADAYGLSRDQYAHVLSTFSHASYRKAPELCLARFDELKQLGLDAFTRKYDPYWDIPLNGNLPQPVIDLPLPGESMDGGRGTADESDGEFRLTGTTKPTRRGRKKR